MKNSNLYIVCVPILLFSIISCVADSTKTSNYDTSIQNSEIVNNEDTNASDNKNKEPQPRYKINKSKSGEYDLWSIEELPLIFLEECEYIPYPTNGILDKPISKTKARLLADSPVIKYKEATWIAANRALKNLIPIPDSKVIFNYSKIDRQINNANQCRFQGDCEIQDPSGKYVEAYFNILVTYPDTGGSPSNAKFWRCSGSIVF